MYSYSVDTRADRTKRNLGESLGRSYVALSQYFGLASGIRETGGSGSQRKNVHIPVPRSSFCFAPTRTSAIPMEDSGLRFSTKRTRCRSSSVGCSQTRCSSRHSFPKVIIESSNHCGACRTKSHDFSLPNTGGQHRKAPDELSMYSSQISP